MKQLSHEEYNYKVFSLQAHEALDNYANSPKPGAKADEYPLWDMEGDETSLKSVLGEHSLTVIEFGSIT